MNNIKFGTSGWRGIIAEDFTFEGIRVVTQAIADYLKAHDEAKKGVVVGYDARFMGEKFASEAVKILAGNGIKSFLTNRPTPTPVIALEILRRKTGGGINITASHNPSEYNGLKFSSSSGEPALPNITKEIEKRANAMMLEVAYSALTIEEARNKDLLQEIEPFQFYSEYLKQKINIPIIKKAQLGVGVDLMYGAGRGYLDKILEDAGCNIEVFHNHTDPSFGGRPPDPSTENLTTLIDAVKENSYDLGLALDGDADRFGVIDGDGTFIEPNYILALLFDYMLRVQGMTGGAARSVATSHLVDAVANYYKMPVYETPVGFKYIGELITTGKILIGGEESAGLSIRGHVPEKDGMLTCLLVTEMVAREGKSLKDLLNDLYKRVGKLVTKRENIHVGNISKSGLANLLDKPPKMIAGLSVENIRDVGGVNFLLEGGGWLLMRESGTEPVVRLYGEARDEEELERVMKAGRELILGADR
ncbi:MAG: phosphoglucomutase/phosphomannomutase family protein [Deltaproteobacteria bacterium]|nr:phosphoglucomutase/phosphomannomutase family protein [Deltaproteobacteria bacterium]